MKAFYSIAFAIVTAIPSVNSYSMRGRGGMMGSSNYGNMMGKNSGSMMGPSNNYGCQSMMDAFCPKHECPDESSAIVECPNMGGIANMDERRQNALDCVCCRDDGVAELQAQNLDEEVSVMLARVLADSDSDINPASRKTTSLVTVSFAVVAAICGLHA